MPNATYKRWTADEIVKLKNMAQKLSPADIAAQLGRSMGATIVQAHKMKISLRRDRYDEAISPVTGEDER